MPELNLTAAVSIFAAFAGAGLLKGATGAGAPVVAIPVMAAFFDVRLAVILMVVPNMLSNSWQIRKFWTHRLGGGFSLRFAVSGAVGALAGTYLLATMPVRVLLILVTAVVIFYILLRLLRPDFHLPLALAHRLVIPFGFAGGILQGAAGLSAPASVSFLNAMRLPRPAFIATISAFFVTMSLVQFSALTLSGLMTVQLIGLSLLAFIPMTLCMPIGSWAASRWSAAVFDRVTLVMLAILAARLFYTIIAGAG